MVVFGDSIGEAGIGEASFVGQATTGLHGFRHAAGGGCWRVLLEGVGFV